MAITSEKQLKSALYQGWVGHCRFAPKHHAFRYKIFMCFLDLDEIDEVFNLSPLWSKNRFNLARFKREDYFDGAKSDLKTGIRNEVKRQLDLEIDGSIRMLTNLRYFGFIMNPLTIYYCYDKYEKLQALVLEVTNTPWGERHHYAIKCDPNKNDLRTHFGKAFHVSPFIGMNIEYEWYSSTPEDELKVNMKNRQISGNPRPIFEASLNMKRKTLSARTMNLALLSYPLVTLKVFLSIYLQAIKLFFKGVPVYSHPGYSNPGKTCSHPGKTTETKKSIKKAINTQRKI